MTIAQFTSLLESASRELHEANSSVMSSPALVPTPNVIDAGDVDLFFRGVDAGVIRVERGGKFNTWDRPKPGGRWSLLSRSKAGGWYNAEYLPQLAAYVEAILDLGYSKERVLFELPAASLQLDLAILDDDGAVVVLGEAKRDVGMLDKLERAVSERFGDVAPDDESKKRGDEARQLAWRLWTVAPSFTWLIGPGRRTAFETAVAPLTLRPLSNLPHARDLGLDHRPPRKLDPPLLAR